MPHALLLVTMEPAAGMEEEFNDWYDLEHCPQRKSLPGFVFGTRWVCLDGWPRYLALYGMESEEAVRTPEYLAVSGANGTPWSKRMLARTIGRQRHVAVAVAGNEPLRAGLGTCSRLLMAGWTCAEGEAKILCAKARVTAAALPGVRECGGFLVPKGQESLFWFFVALDYPARMEELAALARPDGRGATIFNLYAPYFRSGY